MHGVGWFLETAYKDIILFCVAVWIQGMFVKNVNWKCELWQLGFAGGRDIITR